MFEPLEYIILALGMILVAIGAFCDLAGALGMVRFPNFFVRLHAATVGSIGGAVIPLIGVALIALVSDQLGFFKWAISGGALVAALIILLVAPAGSHALAYSAHKSRAVPVEPKVCDLLEEHERMKAERKASEEGEGT
ncbi:MAG: cation:proton antiporter [Desulfurococcales archaeon ex4484_217_2]|nr:MAG: cation:proton antiporter [Desulfurococcales archaeon ex4484_217_2]